MKQLAFSIILICCMTTAEVAHTQTWNRKYNLDMSSQMNWEISPSVSKYESGDEKTLLHVNLDKEYFRLRGSVQLPKASPNSECEVAVRLQADTLHIPLMFKVEVADDKEEIISSQHIVITPQDNRWHEYTVKLSRIAAVSELFLQLDTPELLSGESDFRIDRFIIRIDGEDIGEWNVAEKLTDDQATLNPRYTVSLDFDDAKTDVTSRIGDLKKQRFVALGECTHGSASIQDARLRFCKDMIRNRKYRYLIFEYEAIPMLALDFYVQGYDLPNTERYIKDFEMHPLFGPPFIDFIEWIRQYNLTHRQKVRILGMDTWNKDRLSPFFRDLLPQDEADVCCRLFEEKRFVELFNVIRDNARLYAELGDALFDTLVAILECADFMLDPKQFDLDKRDRRMFQFVAHLDKRLLQKNERAIILAHTVHISCRTAPGTSGKVKSMGYYMSEKYNDEYLSLAFQIGQGQYLQDLYDNSFFPMFADTVRTPIEGSFEQAAMRTGLKYLYYPSAQLDDNTVYIATIHRNSSKGIHYHLLELKFRHEGYIFIRDSRPGEYRISDGIKKQISMQ